MKTLGSPAFLCFTSACRSRAQPSSHRKLPIVSCWLQKPLIDVCVSYWQKRLACGWLKPNWKFQITDRAVWQVRYVNVLAKSRRQLEIWRCGTTLWILSRVQINPFHDLSAMHVVIHTIIFNIFNWFFVSVCICSRKWTSRNQVWYQVWPPRLGSTSVYCPHECYTAPGSRSKTLAPSDWEEERS